MAKHEFLTPQQTRTKWISLKLLKREEEGGGGLEQKIYKKVK